MICSKSRLPKWTPVAASIGFALLLMLLWEVVLRAADYPAFILPTPSAILKRGIVEFSRGRIWLHVWTTTYEVLVGLLLGVSAAVVTGYSLSRSDLVERMLSPFIVAAQSIPTVALAPLLVIWMGFGTGSKVAVCAMVVFFPMMVSTLVGFRSVPEELHELMGVLRASRWQRFSKLEVPAALPVLLGGMRMAVTLAVTGAVVGEFVGADRGLGFLVSMGKGLFDTPLMFVALVGLMLLAVTLYVTVLMVEKRLLRWRG